MAPAGSTGSDNTTNCCDFNHHIKDYKKGITQLLIETCLSLQPSSFFLLLQSVMVAESFAYSARSLITFAYAKKSEDLKL